MIHAALCVRNSPVPMFANSRKPTCQKFAVCRMCSYPRINPSCRMWPSVSFLFIGPLLPDGSVWRDTRLSAICLLNQFNGSRSRCRFLGFGPQQIIADTCSKGPLGRYKIPNRTPFTSDQEQ